MPCADATAVAPAAATRASAAGDKHSEQQRESPSPTRSTPARSAVLRPRPAPLRSVPVRSHATAGAGFRCSRRLGLAAVVTIFKSTLVSPSPEATWLGVNVQVVSAGIPRPAQDKVTSPGKTLPFPRGHDVEVVAGGLSGCDGLAGRIVVDGEIEADDQFHRSRLVDMTVSVPVASMVKLKWFSRIVAGCHRKRRTGRSRSQLLPEKQTAGQRDGSRATQVDRAAVTAGCGQRAIEHSGLIRIHRERWIADG